MISSARWSWWSIALLAGVHALLFGIAFEPLNLWPAIFLAPVPLIVAAVCAASWKTLAGWIFLAQILLWLAIESWVGEISVAGWPPLGAYLACYGVAMALAIRRLAGKHADAGIPFLIIVPIVWLGFEFLRGSILLGGYPWYLLGQPLIGWLPLAQPADIAGILFVSLLPAAVAGGIADLLFARRLSPRLRLASSSGAALLLVAWIAYGVARIRPLQAGEEGPAVLLLQTNIPASIKVSWSPEDQLQDALRFARSTLDGFDEMRTSGIEPSLAVWPETMLPGPGLEKQSVDEYIRGGWFPGDSFRQLAQSLREQGGVALLMGSRSFEGLLAPEDSAMTWKKRFNSVYLVDKALPDARYDKVHLTPFGERMPLISDFPWLEQKLLDFGASGMSFDLDEAETPVGLSISFDADGETRQLQIGTPICFEDTLPWVCRELIWDEEGNKAGLMLVSVSNDGWFGSSDASRLTHLQSARFRAIENRVPVLRSVNTGVSAWIDSSGRLKGQLDPGKEGRLVARPRLDRGWTVFGAIGQLPSGIMFVLLILSLVAGPVPFANKEDAHHDT